MLKKNWLTVIALIVFSLFGCQTKITLPFGDSGTSTGASTGTTPPLGQGGPLTYTARTDNQVLPGPSRAPAALTGLLGANNKYSDPDFNNASVIRITDSATQSNGWVHNGNYMTNSAGENNPWNYDSSIFMVHGAGMLLYKWNVATMTATRMDSTTSGEGLLTDVNGVAVESDGADFGHTNNNKYSFYSTAGTKFYKFDINTSAAVWDQTAIKGNLILDANAPNCLNGALDEFYAPGDFGLDSNDNRGVVVFNHSIQNSATYVVAYDIAKGGCRWYNTLTGQIGGNFGSGSGVISNATFPSLPSPLRVPSITDAQGGSLISGHTYKINITYTVPTGETNPSPVTVHTIAAGFNALKISAPAQPNTPPQDPSGYNIYICDQTVSNGCIPTLQTALPAPTGVTCSAVKMGTRTDTYWIIAKNAAGASAPSVGCVVSNSFNPPNSQNNTLSWSAVPGSTSYDIMKDQSTLNLINVSTTSYTDNGKYVATSINSTNTMTSSPTILTLNTTSPAVPSVNTAGYTLHNVKIDKSGTWVKITLGSGTSIPTYMIWEVDSNVVVPVGGETDPIPGVSDINGHQALGFGLFLSDTGRNGSFDFDSHLISNTVSGMDLTEVHMVNYNQYKDLTGSTWNIFGDQHMSYANGGPSNAQPVLASTDPTTADAYGPYTAPGEGEIVGIPMGSNNMIYRFCHNWSAGAADGGFWASPRGNVSQDGKWYLYTSDMQLNNKGYGVGSTSGTATCTPNPGSTDCRTDVFICQLK